MFAYQCRGDLAVSSHSTLRLALFYHNTNRYRRNIYQQPLDSHLSTQDSRNGHGSEVPYRATVPSADAIVVARPDTVDAVCRVLDAATQQEEGWLCTVLADSKRAAGCAASIVRSGPRSGTGRSSTRRAYRPSGRRAERDPHRACSSRREFVDGILRRFPVPVERVLTVICVDGAAVGRSPNRTAVAAPVPRATARPFGRGAGFGRVGTHSSLIERQSALAAPAADGRLGSP